jgi:hypothetical protein
MLLSAALVIFWAASFSPNLTFDDAYITYRYADNFRHGLGLVYNPGERVLGTTTPLYALLLGAIGLLGGDLEWLGHWLSALAWIGASWAALGLLRQVERPRAGYAGAVLISLQPAIFSSLGMETALLVALMFVSAWAWVAQKRVPIILSSAALLLTRYDAALWLLAIALTAWLYTRRFPWREVLGVALLVAPWFVFAQLYYGSFVPNSIIAKIGQNRLMAVGGMTQSFASTFLGMALTNAVWPVMIAIGLSLTVGLWGTLRTRPSLAALPVWVVCDVVIYNGLGVVNFPWYFVPPLSVTSLIAALGIGILLGDEAGTPIAIFPPRVIQVARPALVGVALISLALLVIDSWQRLQLVQPNRVQSYPNDYRQVAEWLNQNTPPGTRVASIEVGTIGYFSQRSILDTMGLVSPEMNKHLVGWQATLVYAVNQFHPEYAVTLTGTAWEFVRSQWWFAESYQPVASFGRVTLYKRLAPAPLCYTADDKVSYESGFSLDGVQAVSQRLQPGQDWDAYALLSVRSPVPDDYEFSFYLVDAQNYQRYALTKMLPFNGGYESYLWQAGDRMRMPIRIAVPADLPPGTYRFGVFVYDATHRSGVRLQGTGGGDAQLGWLRSGDPSDRPAQFPVGRAMSAQWQGGITLASIGLPQQALKPGSTLPVALTWRVTQTPSRDLTEFAHLMSADGELVAQQDQRPLYGRFSTAVWQPGEVLHDYLEVKLPSDLPPGAYRLDLGFYDPNGRLSLQDNQGDLLRLPDEITVAR